MLAKQAWRIIHRPESLLARILHAKYFPTRTFFIAQPGMRPSCMWKSLLAAKEVIIRGSRKEDHSQIGYILEDIKELMRTQPGSKFACIRGQANVTAHRLAQFVLSCDVRVEWFEKPPDII
ncbi:PREDICTED: reverse mRNAase [Prunus dulcis]|uniref:PREDICTED: reverse mRNAase n=1 Tax=Prunus dulcis TaxID=3755 RepID=A0A5E4FSQ0_PRUDU|nr:PREDICTED: reverse mRNAase [Prunus dulcis]